MGEARRKVMNAAQIVEFDFAKPQCAVLLSDRAVYEKLEVTDPITAWATKLCMTAAVNAAHTQGIDRKSGRIWAAWLELMEENATTFKVPKSQIEWLRDLIAKDDLRLPSGFAQWREELVDYLDELMSIESESETTDVLGGKHA